MSNTNNIFRSITDISGDPGKFKLDVDENINVDVEIIDVKIHPDYPGILSMHIAQRIEIFYISCRIKKLEQSCCHRIETNSFS